MRTLTILAATLLLFGFATNPVLARGDSPGKGKGGPDIETQMQKEEAKHRTRVAKLERIRELLVEKNDEKGVARVDRILAKEREQYEKKMKQLRARDDKAAENFDRKMEKVREKERQRGGKGKGKGKARDGDDDGAGRGKGKGKARDGDDDDDGAGHGKGKARDGDDDDDGRGKGKARNGDDDDDDGRGKGKGKGHGKGR